MCSSVDQLQCKVKWRVELVRKLGSQQHDWLDLLAPVDPPRCQHFLEPRNT